MAQRMNIHKRGVPRRFRTMQERLFKENLKILSINHPSLVERLRDCKENVRVEMIKAKSGDYTCKFKGLTLHSLYDPQKEASRLIRGIDPKAKAIFVLGFGLGYHVQKLLEEVSPQAKIVVIDPSLALFKEAIRYMELSYLLKTPKTLKIEFLIGEKVRDILGYIRRELSPIEIKSNEIALLQHHSSMRLYPSYYNDVMKVIPQSLERGERIAIISLSDWEKDPSRKPLWGDFWVKYELTNEFTKMGYVVTNEEPEIIIHLFGFPIRGLPKDTYNIIWIYSHPDEVTPFILRGYDKIFCLSSSFIQRIKQMGFEAELMIGATSKKPIQREIKYDILLVGNKKQEWHIRQEIVQEIISGTSYNFKVWGDGWESILPKDYYGGKYIDYRRIEELYASSLVSLNDHHEDMRREGFVSVRIFDILASGGFAISDKNPGIDEIFVDTVPQYESPAHLRELLDFYINNPDERIRLMKKGQEIALSHTWQKRAMQFLEGLDTAELEKKKKARKDIVVSRRGDQGDRRIFYIDYFSPKNSNFYWLKGFQKFGLVEAFDIIMEDKELLYDRIMDFRPDHIHLGGSVKGDMVSPGLLFELKERIGCTISQFYGDHQYRIHHRDEIPKVVDYVYITNKTDIRFYKEKGFSNFRYMPCPTDPEVFNHQECEKECYDVIFIGNNYSLSRLALLKKISNLFNLKVFGEGWQGTGLSYEPPVWAQDFSRICSSAKVVLGLMEEERARLEACFSNRLTNTLATRSFLIQTYTSGLEEVFTNRKHLVWYMDEEELFGLIDYYLKNEQERKKIALLGQREVYEKYTFEKSIERILDECKGGEKSAFRDRVDQH
jgi:spore maturation protein CgeB